MKGLLNENLCRQIKRELRYTPQGRYNLCIEIAKRAGCSVELVIKILNGQRSVETEKGKRVMKVIRKVLTEIAIERLNEINQVV